MRAVGLINVEVTQASRRQGYGTYLVNELFRHQSQQGVALVEAQTMPRNTAAIAFYDRLGFREVDRGAVFRKM